jgi:hypothetical protein
MENLELQAQNGKRQRAFIFSSNFSSLAISALLTK